MGHHRLHGRLPNTVPWRRVVEKIANGSNIANIVAATLEAANEGLAKAKGDYGIHLTIHLLTCVVLSARESDFPYKLRQSSIQVDVPLDVFELTAAFGEAVEEQTRRYGPRTDLGEMARLAGMGALHKQLQSCAINLFEVTSEQVQKGVYKLSTSAGFRQLAFDFFTDFMKRFLLSHLGWELPHHVDKTGRFANTSKHTEFIEELERHCSEKVVIVKTYAEEWYSKQNFLGGITLKKAGAFADHCMKKFEAHLKVGV